MPSRTIGGRFDQRPSSKAVRAAATARSTSAFDASTMRVTSLPLDGSITAMVLSCDDDTHSLLMNSAGGG